MREGAEEEVWTGKDGENLTELQKALAYDKTFQCIQCGYCLPACPTYETMGKETHSPRGRINLVKMAAEGKVPLSELAGPIDLCLGCRTCETVCPTGVEYGQIYEAVKHALARRKEGPFPARLLQKATLRYLLPSPKRMRCVGSLLWFYQASGLQKITRRTRLVRRLPAHLGEFEAAVSDLASPRERRATEKRWGSVYAGVGIGAAGMLRDGRLKNAGSPQPEPGAEGKWQGPSVLLPYDAHTDGVHAHERPAHGEPTPSAPKKKAGFFHGCIMDAMFHHINALSMALLEMAGYDVVLIPSQTCCGALDNHAGERELAKQLAKQNILATEAAHVDWVVNNAGGCGAQLVEYSILLADELDWRGRAERFVARVRDISQLLAEGEELPFKQEIPEVVTYQPSCHMRNVQKVTREPLALLEAIPGVRYREMQRAERCCGSAGIYNLVHFDEAMEMLGLKMARVKETAATTVVTTNPGCLLQMKVGIEREGLGEKVRAVHLVELLAEAVGISKAHS